VTSYTVIVTFTLPDCHGVYTHIRTVTVCSVTVISRQKRHSPLPHWHCGLKSRPRCQGVHGHCRTVYTVKVTATLSHCHCVLGHGRFATEEAWPGDLAALLDAQEDLTRVPFSSTGQDTGPATKKPRLEQPSYHANIPAAAALSNATSRLPTGPQATSP
jgi:hypothetical protein